MHAHRQSKAASSGKECVGSAYTPRGLSLSQTTVGRWQLDYRGRGRQEGGRLRARTMGPGWGGKVSPRRSTSGGVWGAPVSSPADEGFYVWRGWPWAVVDTGEYVCVEEDRAGYQPTPMVDDGGWEEKSLAVP